MFYAFASPSFAPPEEMIQMDIVMHSFRCNDPVCCITYKERRTSMLTVVIRQADVWWLVRTLQMNAVSGTEVFHSDFGEE
jgi:hypothetical protein